MGCIFIIAGGSIGDKDFLRSQIDMFGPDELVCADGGARHVAALDLTPQVIIGDMDSLTLEILQRCEGRGSRIIRHPRRSRKRTPNWLWNMPAGLIPTRSGYMADWGDGSIIPWPISPCCCRPPREV